MDLPATAPRSVSPTCASESRAKALPSPSPIHKSRARTASAHRARVITSEKKLRNVSGGSELDRSKVKEGSLARRDARISNENVSLLQQLEQAANTNQLLCFNKLYTCWWFY